MTAPPGEPPPPTGGEEDEDFMPGDEKYTPEDEVQFVLNFCNERGISLPEAVDVGECVFLYSYGRKQILQIRRHLPDGPIPEAVYYLYYPLEGMEISSQIDRKELEITSGTDTYLVGKDNAGEISVCSEMPYAGDFIASCTAEYPESGEDETVIFVEVITSQPTKKEYIEELRQELEVNRGPRPRIVVASDLVHIMYNNLIDFDTVNIPHKAVHPWTTIVDGIFEKIWDWEFHTSNEAKSADNKLLDAIRSMLHLRIYDRKVGEKILEAKSDKEIEELIYNCIEEMYFDF